MSVFRLRKVLTILGMLALASVLVLPGCKKKAPKETAAPTKTGDISPVESADTTGQSARELREAMDRDIARIMPVYFDYDRSDILAGERDKVRTTAEILRKWPGWTVTVEGHCDERGTNEYNLALGERRAKSAQRALVSEGISTDRLSIISYGEERPADPGHTDASWSRNRRAEFRVDIGNN